jgi:hypothetical protein
MSHYKQRRWYLQEEALHVRWYLQEEALHVRWYLQEEALHVRQLALFPGIQQAAWVYQEPISNSQGLSYYRKHVRRFSPVSFVGLLFDAAVNV